MTDTDELIAFVRRCLDDDERIAKAATWGGTPWRMEGTSIVGRSWQASTASPETLVVRHTWSQEAAHIVRWDPNRVIAEVKAKRRILDDIAGRLSPREDDGGWESADAETDGMASTTLRRLAQSFAGWDGWREEWKTS